MIKNFICENPECRKPHDGSYGSGRFCSLKCKKRYCGIIGGNKFAEVNKNSSRKGKPQNHSKSRAPYGTWKCKYCDLVFDTRAKLTEHNKLIHLTGNTIPWNKGLNKHNDIRIYNASKKISNSLKQKINEGYVNPTWTDEYWSPSKRKETSDKKIQYYIDNPEKHPNVKLAGNRNKMTYFERVAFDWLTENNIEFEHQKFFKFDNKRRFVDFYVKSRKLIIEIDGEYWHKDSKIDLDKDLIAKQNGYETLRIKPKDNVINQLKLYFNK